MPIGPASVVHMIRKRLSIEFLVTATPEKHPDRSWTTESNGGDTDAIEGAIVGGLIWLAGLLLFLTGAGAGPGYHLSTEIISSASTQPRVSVQGPVLLCASAVAR